jgi:hypothetical protein
LVKHLIILILCSFACFILPLTAETEELPELQGEILQENWLQKLYDELNIEGHQLSANSRFRISDSATNGLVSIQLIEKELQLNVNGYSTKAGPLKANFTLARKTPKTTVREIYLGNLRPVWGLGTVFKTGGAEQQLYSVKKAPHPLYVSPQGVSLLLSENDFYLYFMAALESRSARIQDEKIASLYQSKREDIAKVTEQLLSAGLEYRQPSYAIGTMAYWQGYNRAFVNPGYSQDLAAFSLSGKLKSKTSYLAAEGSLIGDKGAVQATAGYKLQRVEQSISFATRQNIQMPAYASKPFLLSSLGQRTEFSWNLDFPLADELDLGLRHALLRNNSSLKSPAWISRSILSLAYKPESSTVNLQLSRMDREVVAIEDAAYANTLPIHYRGKLQFKQTISKPLELKVLFRYHYEDKIKTENNSFFWENSLTYKKKALQLEAGLQSWQSLRSIISAEDDLSDPDGLSTATSEDNQVFAGFRFRWHTIHLAAEIHQSWLTSWRNIYVSIGI